VRPCVTEPRGGETQTKVESQESQKAQESEKAAEPPEPPEAVAVAVSERLMGSISQSDLRRITPGRGRTLFAHSVPPHYHLRRITPGRRRTRTHSSTFHLNLSTLYGMRWVVVSVTKTPRTEHLRWR